MEAEKRPDIEIQESRRMKPNIVTSAMERAVKIWPEMDWWGAGDECLGLSFGGGVNTTALSLLLLWMGRKIEHIFSDLGLGAEHPRTVAFIESYSEMVREAGCKFIIIGPNSLCRIPSERMPLLEYIELHRCSPRVPGPRWCTVSFKIRPIHKYARLKFYGQLIGFSSEEAGRVSDQAGLYYPLVEADIDRQDCYGIIDAFGICNPGKSGCMFCPRVSRRQIYELWQDDLIDHRVQVEEIPWKAGRNSNDPKEGQIVPLRHRDKLTRTMIAEWERGENIPKSNEGLEDLPCACKW